jgi:hypothetical protein
VERWPPARRAYAAYASERILVRKADNGLFSKNVESTIFDDIRQSFIFSFQLQIVPNYSKKINAMMCPFDSLFFYRSIPLSQNPSFHYSYIPVFQLGRSP